VAKGVESAAARSAADKLKESIERLRVLRRFEDEPASFTAWIQSHAPDRIQGDGGADR
jgi:hypothetical protein